MANNTDASNTPPTIEELLTKLQKARPDINTFEDLRDNASVHSLFSIGELSRLLTKLPTKKELGVDVESTKTTDKDKEKKVKESAKQHILHGRPSGAQTPEVENTIGSPNETIEPTNLSMQVTNTPVNPITEDVSDAPSQEAIELPSSQPLVPKTIPTPAALPPETLSHDETLSTKATLIPNSFISEPTSQANINFDIEEDERRSQFDEQEKILESHERQRQDEFDREKRRYDSKARELDEATMVDVRRRKTLDDLNRTEDERRKSFDRGIQEAKSRLSPEIIARTEREERIKRMRFEQDQKDEHAMLTRRGLARDEERRRQNKPSLSAERERRANFEAKKYRLREEEMKNRKDSRQQSAIISQQKFQAQTRGDGEKEKNESPVAANTLSSEITKENTNGQLNPNAPSGSEGTNEQEDFYAPVVIEESDEAEDGFVEGAGAGLAAESVLDDELTEPTSETEPEPQEQHKPQPTQSQDSSEQDNSSQQPSQRIPRKQIDQMRKGTQAPGRSRFGNPLNKLNPANMLKKGTRGAAKSLAKTAAKQVATKAVTAVAATPVGWVIGGVVAIVLLLFFAIFMTSSDDSGFGGGNEPVTIVVSNPKQNVQGVSTSTNGDSPTVQRVLAANNEIATFQIDVSFPGRADDIEITAPIPVTADFYNASGINHLDCVPNTDCKFVKKVTWSLKENQTDGSVNINQSSESTSPGGKIDITKYTAPPYSLLSPSSTGGPYTSQQITDLNSLGNTVAKYQSFLLSKFASQYVDPFLSVIWSGAIEGSNGNPYSWNCKDESRDINNGCNGGYTSGGWQVGGAQVSQAASHLSEDFQVAYGSTEGKVVQSVGQKVIQEGNITNPSSFPPLSVGEIVQMAGKPLRTRDERMPTSQESQAQQMIAILLMDRQVNALAVSREVAGDIMSQGNWRVTLEGWGDYYRDNMQRFSNNMKTISDVYTGIGGTSGTGGRTFRPQKFTINLKPRGELDSGYIDFHATARLIGRVSTSTQPNIGVTNPGSGLIDTKSVSLDQMFKDASEYSSVPVAFLKATNKLETGVISEWTDKETAEFSIPNWWVGHTDDDPLVVKGWGFNMCAILEPGTCFSGADVRGIMQFELATWNGVKAALNFSDGHDPERRYPKDSIMGSGILIKDISRQYDERFGVIGTATDWPEDKVRRVGTAYCTGSLTGDPNDEACSLGGDAYDNIVWKYYQEFKGEGGG